MAVLEATNLPRMAVRRSRWAAIRARHGGRSLGRLLAAAILTLGPAVVHLAVAPGHYIEYRPYGVLFTIVGVAGLALAAAILLAPSGLLFVAAALGTGGVITTWFVSRLVGLPLAPVPWTPEVPGMLDMLTTLTEIIAVVLYLRLIGRPRRPHDRGPVKVSLVAVPAVPLTALCVLLGVGAFLNPMPAAFNASPAIPGQSTVSVASLVAPPGPEPVDAFTLTASRLTIDGHPAWGFNGSVPGPELRVTQGHRVKVTLVNFLDHATSIHWHGVNVPNAMDGVSGVTQNAVWPGHSFTYEFVAGEAGTYWYHTHEEALDQLPRGLYGALIVLPRAGVAQAHDYTALIHTLVGSGNQTLGSGAVAVNGTPRLHLAAAPGDTVRLRLINAAIPSGFSGAPLAPMLVGARYRVVALDGHDLNKPQELGPEQIRLGMGQRADLVFTMPASGQVMLTGLKGTRAFPWEPAPNTATVSIGDGPAPEPVVHAPLFDLTTYGEPAPDPVATAGAYDVERTLVLTGGPGFRNGTYDFEDGFNGFASPVVPPIHVRFGQLVKLRLVNHGAGKFHPVHIHGHTFTVVARNGHSLTGSPVHLDAVLVPPGETWDVAFKADNPGIWMLHCHVLGHAWAGMSMTVNYDGVSTPFTMGTTSKNEPE